MYIVSIGKNSLVIADDKTSLQMEVPVSRRLYNKVNDEFIQFYKQNRVEKNFMQRGEIDENPMA